MPRRALFSERTGRPRTLSEPDFAEVVWTGVAEAVQKGVLAEAFGVHRDAEGRHAGPGVHDAEGYLLRALKASGLGHSVKRGGLPPAAKYHEALLLDLLEFLHVECVSEPAGREHGSHDETIFNAPFDREAGQRIFREKVNPLLGMHEPPLELLASGQIVEHPSDELRPLVTEPLPEEIEPEIRDPLDAAKDQFLHRGSTVQDRRAAVKHLADVLERMRDEIKHELLSEDERALFRIANEFSIRHNKRDQRGDYDKDVWLEWTFYIYLATARAMIALQHRQADGDAAESVPSDDLPF